MKIKSLLLGVAIVALMASCGNKATETTTESMAEETPVEATVETPAETIAEGTVEATAPAKQDKNAKKQSNTTARTEEAKQPAVDPCEAKVKNFEKWVDELKAAKKNKSTGAAALKNYADLKGKAASMEASIKDCTNNPDYKTRLQNAILAEKQAR